MLWALLLAATRPVDPSLEPVGVEDAYRAWALAEGRPDGRAELVCRAFAEGARLCFVWRDPTRRVYVTRADGLDLATVEAQAAADAAAAVAGMSRVVPDGFTRAYHLRAEGDGRDHAPLLAPDALAARVGGPPVVGVPARGVLVAWLPGDPAFDKVVAVGVRRMFETLPDPVSPSLWRWEGGQWKLWGEVRELTPAPAAAGG